MVLNLLNMCLNPRIKIFTINLSNFVNTHAPIYTTIVNIALHSYSFNHRLKSTYEQKMVHMLHK